MTMNKIDYQLFTTIAHMEQKSLLNSMKNFLKKYYSSDAVTETPDYILCEGTAPIMLVAHMDTVFNAPPQNIYYDQVQHVLWSPQGLGADDRAGVFLIMKIIQNGYRPHICLTTEEEKGGIGAALLTSRCPKPPFNIKYIVQLDRQGYRDCVFYSCDNKDFQNFIEKYDFVTGWGSFSDISIICPVWKIAGVNVSVGYFNEHTISETLHTDMLYSTLKKVQKMIKEIEKAPYFEYIELSQPYCLSDFYTKFLFPTEEDFGVNCYDNFSRSYNCQCQKCKKFFNEDDVFLVKTKGNPKEWCYYCVDCVSFGVNWCEGCGEPFETNKNDDVYCADCKNKKHNKTAVIL